MAERHTSCVQATGFASSNLAAGTKLDQYNGCILQWSEGRTVDPEIRVQFPVQSLHASVRQVIEGS